MAQTADISQHTANRKSDSTQRAVFSMQGIVLLPENNRITDDAEEHAQKDVRVLYACYGSNLMEERFHCYLRGGRVDGMKHDCPGARDPSPALESHNIRMPYRVFFAHADESVWGYGGGAMLDITPSDKHQCYMRLYKVTLPQFNDIVAQENGLLPPLPITNRLTREHLTDLQQRGRGSLRLQFENGLYPAISIPGRS